MFRTKNVVLTPSRITGAGATNDDSMNPLNTVRPINSPSHRRLECGVSNVNEPINAIIAQIIIEPLV